MGAGDSKSENTKANGNGSNSNESGVAPASDDGLNDGAQLPAYMRIKSGDYAASSAAALSAAIAADNADAGVASPTATASAAAASATSPTAKRPAAVDAKAAAALSKSAADDPQSPLSPPPRPLSIAAASHPSPHTHVRRAVDSHLSAEQLIPVLRGHRFDQLHNKEHSDTAHMHGGSEAASFDSYVVFNSNGSCWIEHAYPSGAEVVTHTRSGKWTAEDGGRVRLVLTEHKASGKSIATNHTDGIRDTVIAFIANAQPHSATTGFVVTGKAIALEDDTPTLVIQSETCELLCKGSNTSATAAAAGVTVAAPRDSYVTRGTRYRRVAQEF